MRKHRQRRQPLWAKLAVDAYCIVFAVLLFGPILLQVFFEDSRSAFVAVFVAFSCFMLTLLFLGIAASLDDATRTRWDAVGGVFWSCAALFGSSFLACLVSLGFGLALDEFITGDSGDFIDDGILIGISVLSVWIGWVILFGGLIATHGPQRISRSLWLTLSACSAAEILVTVPMHLVTRDRLYNGAGAMTGFAIVLGAIVLVVALGPAVFLLCYRRYQQVYSRNRDTGGD